MADATRGYYSLIQYCPDRSRMESANVGVVLFCPDQDYLDLLLAGGNDRLRRFFKSGTFDPDAIRLAKKAIANRFRHDRSAFRTIDDLEQFINTRANLLMMTPARPVKIVNAEQELKALFDELVGGRSRQERESRARHMLDSIFRQPEFRGLIEFDRVVQVPIISSELRVPFTYRNGAVNLVKPQEFPPSVTSASNMAMRLAMAGNLLWKHGIENDNRMKLTVVASFPPETESSELPQRVFDLFKSYEVESIPISKAEELADRILHEAH